MEHRGATRCSRSMARSILSLALMAVFCATAAAVVENATGRSLAPQGCLGTPVQGNTVKAGPFTGYVVPAYDSVGGRFSLRVGGMRTATLSSKIPWFVPFRYKVSDSVVISGRRAHAPARAFRQTEALASAGDSRGWVFPSIIEPPTVGCWRLTFRSGEAVGTLTVLVRPAIKGEEAAG